MKGFLKY